MENAFSDGVRNAGGQGRVMQVAEVIMPEKYWKDDIKKHIQNIFFPFIFF
jgi:hypothetical protein